MEDDRPVPRFFFCPKRSHLYTVLFWRFQKSLVLEKPAKNWISIFVSHSIQAIRTPNLNCFGMCESHPPLPLGLPCLLVSSQPLVAGLRRVLYKGSFINYPQSCHTEPMPHFLPFSTNDIVLTFQKAARELVKIPTRLSSLV